MVWPSSYRLNDGCRITSEQEISPLSAGISVGENNSPPSSRVAGIGEPPRQHPAKGGKHLHRGSGRLPPVHRPRDGVVVQVVAAGRGRKHASTTANNKIVVPLGTVNQSQLLQGRRVLPLAVVNSLVLGVVVRLRDHQGAGALLGVQCSRPDVQARGQDVEVLQMRSEKAPPLAEDEKI